MKKHLAVVVLGFLVAVWGCDNPSPGSGCGGGGNMPVCDPGERLCQVGADDYVCEAYDEACPDPYDRSIPQCGAWERLCQTGPCTYVCVDLDEPCPDPDPGNDIPDCDPGERLCQVGADDYVCVPYDETCPDPYDRSIPQ